ncbi:winged helix-turn-helix domain-containing protein [Paraburkholderia sediminicola]|uniref:ATP-binding protein n=1 Tax=Paraburkholderia sediminicola TaxID=458836 RepID=UPI0038BA4A08
MLTIGDVEILPDQRRVLVAKKPFNLGSRAFDMLELLASARGNLVSKDEIMRRVWPDTVVVDNNLHVHISAIRKMLGASSNRLIAVPGRGYRLALEAQGSASESLSGCAGREAGHTRTAVQSNLPSPSSTLYGRDEAIEEVIGASESATLISLVGPGGIGKTRLAIEAGRQLVDCFADGVWLVELSRVATPQFVPCAVAEVLDPEGTSDCPPLARIAASLRGANKLILLDNCEHVIQAAADVAAAILAAAPLCKVMVTSREPLKIAGECVYRVRALAVPRQEPYRHDTLETSAVQLFLDRARAIDSRFALDEPGIALAALICRRLDGMPLAIELAASRAATLGIRELAANLDDRLQILTGGYRTALPQHQTLRATFDWSYHLLTPKQQAVLRRVGVFPSLFRLDAATAIAAGDDVDATDVLDAVCALSEKSLLIAEVCQGAIHYRLLETTRAYALQKLADNGEARRSEHRFVSFVNASVGGALGSAGADCDRTSLEQFRVRLDDVRAALHLIASSCSDRTLGAELLITAGPFFFGLGLWAELQQHACATLAAWNVTHERALPAPDLSIRLLMAIAGAGQSNALIGTWAGDQRAGAGDRLALSGPARRNDCVARRTAVSC